MTHNAQISYGPSKKIAFIASILTFFFSSYEVWQSAVKGKIIYYHHCYCHGAANEIE